MSGPSRLSPSGRRLLPRRLPLLGCRCRTADGREGPTVPIGRPEVMADIPRIADVVGDGLRLADRVASGFRFGIWRHSGCAPNPEQLKHMRSSSPARACALSHPFPRGSSAGARRSAKRMPKASASSPGRCRGLRVSTAEAHPPPPSLGANRSISMIFEQSRRGHTPGPR